MPTRWRAATATRRARRSTPCRKRRRTPPSARLAESENRADAIAGLDLSAEPDDVADILIDLARRETKTFSMQFARGLVTEMRNATRLHKDPLRSAGFRVLKAPDVPSVLVELGYVSNRGDLKSLTSEAWRNRTAASIAQGSRYILRDASCRRRPATAELRVQSVRQRPQFQHKTARIFGPAEGRGGSSVMRLFLRFFGWIFAGGTIVFLVGVTAVAGLLWHFSQELPDYSQLQDYEPAVMTRVHAADGQLLAEYARERRLYLPIQAVPRLVINAFIAAEDKSFYEHGGLDFSGIARAGWPTFRTTAPAAVRRARPRSPSRSPRTSC